MAYTIPNYAAGLATSGQASPDKVDFDIVTGGTGLTGVISGCAATVTGTDMNVTIAAGVVIIAGKEVAVSGGAVAVTADGSNPRYTLITVNSSGTKAATAGTPATNPVFPDVPAGSVALHAVYIPAGDTAIGSTQIVDKRLTVVRDTDAMAYIYF